MIRRSDTLSAHLVVDSRVLLNQQYVISANRAYEVSFLPLTLMKCHFCHLCGLSAVTDKVTQAGSFARVAQWIERLPPEQKVEGSIPFAGT